MPRCVQEVVVPNRSGLHTRVCSMIAMTLKNYSSSVFLSKGKVTADCRRVIESLSLGAAQGERLQLVVEGDDAQDTMQAILDLFAVSFHEDQEEGHY